MSAVVRARKIGKRYARYNPSRPQTLKESLIRRFRDVRPREHFWALRDVTFEVAGSEIVGVVGANGAGKSTLLRLIGGVGRPDTGRIDVEGRIAALLELGAGFHPELSGSENIFVSGVIGGLTRAEIRKRFDRIVEFAELAPFIESPLRTYSSGMQLRLAFSINIHTAPQVLLVDELLAVGDMAFQKKCLDMVQQIRADGCAIVFVSHDVHQVRELCDRVLWLRQGSIVMQGDPDSVVRQYQESMMAETTALAPEQWDDATTSSGVLLRLNENRFGSMALEIEDVRFIGPGKKPISQLLAGDGLTVELCYKAHEQVGSPHFTVTLDTVDGAAVAEFSTANAPARIPMLEGQGKIALDIERLDLTAGDYYLEVGAYPADWSHTYDYHWRAHRLRVKASPRAKGLLSPPHRWRFE
jgi:lipopolysaccharide transport system ATP-binding protein